MAQARGSHPYPAILPFALLGGGFLLLLALISYSPGDVPAWFPLAGKAGRAARAGGNFIGALGAVVACTIYAFVGAAAYLVAALLLGSGGLRLLVPERRWGRTFLWALAVVIAGACLAQLSPWTLIDAGRLRVAGEGGWLGKTVGESIFRSILGPVGSVIVLATLYALSLVLLAGVPAKTAFQAVATLPRRALERWTAWREEQAAERTRLGAEAERASREKRRTSKLAPRAERASTRGATLVAGTEESPELALLLDETPPPEPTRPEPKIFDANAPTVRRKEERKEKFTGLSAVTCDGYELPSFDLLDPHDVTDHQAADPEELRAVQTTVIETLAQFGISVAPGDITRGPTITRYEVYPAKGVRVDRIVSLERDIARATRAERINILAPIPGKDTVGIEIANLKKQKVALRELLESDDFVNSKAKIPLALGKDVYGKTIIGDLAAMPHGLVAGTTGSGKSVCINAIIASILYRFEPKDLRFIMIDPKVVEMQIYNALPHLVTPVVTDPKKVLMALRWAIDEMEQRYAIFAKTGVRNIGSFNDRPRLKSQKELDAEMEAAAPTEPMAVLTSVVTDESLPPAEGGEEPPAAVEPGEIDFTNMTDEDLFKVSQPKPKIVVPRDADELIIPDRMPYIVIIVDELADLMQTAPADVESAIARITQKARAAGIHMLIATQTPRADVITGVIKANVPCRVAFQVASALDSRVILDENGAERLLGQGDMLYRPPGTSRLVRSQGVLVTDDEIRRVVEHAAAQSEPVFEKSIHERLKDGAGEDEEVSAEDEELVEKCLEVMRQEKKASTSLFQRRLRLGYTRAARILDILESRGYVAAGEGAKPREILVDLDAPEE